MLLGQKITVYTDHLNLTHHNTQFTSNRVLRQRLVLEEYGVEIKYIQGVRNEAVDALSRMPTEITDTVVEEALLNRRMYEDEVNCPINTSEIKQAQQKYATLLKWLKEGHPTKIFVEILLGNETVWAYKAKRGEEEPLVYVPLDLREAIIEWYHVMLKHPGAERLLATMRTHFNWPGMTKTIENYVKNCDICQKNKITGNKKYGKIPLAEEWDNFNPWECVHVDMVGPWKVKYKLTISEKTISIDLLALTMIDRVTSWPEFAIAHDASAIHNAILFDKNWLCRYPRPLQVIHDNGSEFIGQEFQEMLHSYGITIKPTSVKNPQANSMIERVHLSMGDKLRATTFEGEDWFTDVDQELQPIAWAIHSTINSSTDHTPG